MTLIKSISGIRGTIGGRTGDTLSRRAARLLLVAMPVSQEKW